MPYIEPYFDPRSLNPIEVCEGSALAEGEVPCIPHPPYIVRAEYGRIHVFGDSMTAFLNTTKGEYKPVCKYLKQFCFWNLNDRSRRGAMVLDITEQVRTCFRDWTPQDFTETVVPAMGCPVLGQTTSLPRRSFRTPGFTSLCP